MNYFELFGIHVTLQVDVSLLQRRYNELSRQYHPDTHTKSGDTAVAEQWTVLDQAFLVLSDELQLLRHVLEIKGELAAAEGYRLSSLFMMEMQDIHERLLELEYNPTEEAIAEAYQDVVAMEQELRSRVAPILAGYDDEHVSQGAMDKLKEYYFRRKYLLQIREKLSTFASRN
ncbi:DnaJ domain-containing protein [Chitinophaga agrisoli]|uniref:DnaJ domain-containing protein n=1 Tax=Chitinophaga agrisoli TaxID=2607653 RepID=A0A5B2VSU4_9BACT|nr:DnaJ domain-containing protein [Chitinophaga agrisoli]KAA2242863.1 DnaJ domain-containing protein [Chitinophaga agrisoli]